MSSKSKKVIFETLGCRLNHSESEILKRDLLQRGYQIAGEEDSADLCIVNTCTVTEQGDAKNRQLIRSPHRRHPKASIAVVGCYAQMDGNRISEIPGVQLVLGNEEKMNLPDHINGLEQEGRNQVLIPRIKRGSFQAPIIPKTGNVKELDGSANAWEFRTRASLKIQDGCDFMCSFCIIPFARGRSRYRDFNNLMEEARLLNEEGVK